MTYEQLLTELVEDNEFLYIMTAENRAYSTIAAKNRG